MKSTFKSFKSILLQKALFFVIIIASLMIFISTIFQREEEIVAVDGNFDDLKDDVLLGKYLLDSEACKIQNLKPFSADAMSLFSRLPYKKCFNREPLTSVENNKLIINEKYIMDYLSWWQNDIRCCYQRISRPAGNKTVDCEYALSECTSFTSGHVLDEKDEFILVSCKGFQDLTLVRYIEKEVYRNGHATVLPKKSVEEKFKATSLKRSSLNVLFVGIDNISRLNLIRSMSNTFRHVKNNNWFDMKVYNKIGSNTFPNLMAFLTGLNESAVTSNCDWRYPGELEKCQFLWNDFSDLNYATIYAEDTASLNTFNKYFTGFIRQPTDYYFRPFANAAEEFLEMSYEYIHLSKCMGVQHYADYIYQYGLDFVEKYKNDSFFGLLWANSFSHDDLSLPSEYDVRMKYYLEQMDEKGILNNTVIFFLSDHGMRFGGIMNFFTGRVEANMPFLFIWLPEKFKKEHPKFTKNLKTNENRLTTPFDIYVTVKHILKLSGNLEVNLSTESCPTSQSLFYEVPHNRSCIDACIPNVWCTCSSFDQIDHNSAKIEKAAKFAVNFLNSALSHLKGCAKLVLNEIKSARQSHHINPTDYLITFDVLPSKGLMEATVRCSTESCESLQIFGEISRINRYGDQSWCISDAHLKNYCFCG